MKSKVWYLGVAGLILANEANTYANDMDALLKLEWLETSKKVEKIVEQTNPKWWNFIEEWFSGSGIYTVQWKWETLFSVIKEITNRIAKENKENTIALNIVNLPNYIVPLAKLNPRIANLQAWDKIEVELWDTSQVILTIKLNDGKVFSQIIPLSRTSR